MDSTFVFKINLYNMKNLKLFLMICVSLQLLACSKSDAGVPAEEPAVAKNKNFKVIGYLFARGDLLAQSLSIDYSKITHLNLAFINPDSTGSFAAVPNLEALVKKAHENKVKVISALGGGNPPAYLKEFLKPEKRKLLISGLMQLIEKYDLDGIDVDLEGDFVNENYETFVIELSASLQAKKKLMTAAVATWNSAAYSDKALGLFDLINIMSYDQTGPWRKDKPGPHSTYEQVLVDYGHWNKDRGINSKKLILGLPFYGYGFGPDIRPDMNYGELVATYPGAEKVDLIELPGKGTFYYNGMPTIKKKVDFALENKMGGVMIWQLLGDAPGPFSLLEVIHKEISE
jgi:chitinase